MTANLGPIVQCKVTGSVVNYPCDVVGRCDPACAPGNMDAPTMLGVWGPPIELPVQKEPSFRPRVTMVVDEDSDITLWYLDGTYVGHDDQIDAKDVLEWLGGEVVHADLHQREYPELLSEVMQ